MQRCSLVSDTSNVLIGCVVACISLFIHMSGAQVCNDYSGVMYFNYCLILV